MRKLLGMMSLRLSALCVGSTSQARLFHGSSSAGMQQLQCRQHTIANRDCCTASQPARIFASQAQPAVRPTQTSAYAAQYGDDQTAEGQYVVEKMDYNSMAANAVSLIGNTGKEVEIKRLETGRTVGNLTLACAHRAGQTTW